MKKDFERIDNLFKSNYEFNYPLLLNTFNDYDYDTILLLVIDYFNSKYDVLTNEIIYKLFNYLGNITTYTKIVSFSNMKSSFDELLRNIKNLSSKKNPSLQKFLLENYNLINTFVISHNNTLTFDKNSFEFIMYMIKNVRKLEYCEEIFKNFPEILTIKKNGKYIINRVLSEYTDLIINSPNNPLINYYNQIFDFICKYSYKYVNSEERSNIIIKFENTKISLNKKEIDIKTRKKIDTTIDNIICKLNGKKYNFKDLETLQLYYNINPNSKEYILYRDYHERKDYTNKLAFTIDDAHAGLYDDAISFEKNKDGTILLSIYITDPASSVLLNSNWDKELRNKSETIYMAEHTVHLFNYDLAKEKFSLDVNKNRKVLAYLYHYTPDMQLIDFKIERALINVKKNFNNNEIDRLFYRDRNNYSLSNTELLNVLKDLKIFIEKVGFDINKINRYHELKTIVRNIYGTNYKNRTIKNNNIGSIIISILMLLVKNTTALLMEQNNYPFIYINNSFKLDDNLSNLIETYHINPNNNELIRYIKKIITPSTYGVENLGHNGLGFKANCEITNPLRKYVSLESSRLVKQFEIDKVILNSREEENLINYLDKLCKEQNQIYFCHQEYIKNVKTLIKKSRH